MKIFSAFDEYLTAQEAADWCELQGLQNEIIRRTVFHKDRIGSETLNYSITALQSDMDLIVERALARHLELWAESLNQKIDFEVQSNTFTLDDKLYTGPVFCEFQESGIPDKYFVEETEYTELVMYAKEGQIICETFSDEMTGCFSNTWYRMELPYRTIIFNIGCEIPVGFVIEDNRAAYSLNNVIEEILIAFTKDYNGVYQVLSKDLFFSK